MTQNRKENIWVSAFVAVIVAIFMGAISTIGVSFYFTMGMAFIMFILIFVICELIDYQTYHDDNN